MLCCAPVRVNGEKDHLVPTKLKGIRTQQLLFFYQALKNIFALSWFNLHIIKCILLKFTGWKVLKKYIHVCNLYSSQDSKYSPHSRSLELLCGLLCYPALPAAATPGSSAPVNSGWSTPSQKWDCSGHSSQIHLSLFLVDHYCLFSNLKNRCFNSQRLWFRHFPSPQPHKDPTHP